MNRIIGTTCCVLFVIAFINCRDARAQAASAWVPTGTGDWNEGSNWSLGFLPEARFGDTAIIGNGGTAQVVDSPPAVGGVSLGPGRLEILSGGSLNIVPDFMVNGTLNILGTGSVSIASGGSLEAESVSSTGEIELAGPAASFNVNGNLSLSGTSTLSTMINGANFSPISVGGSAAIGGALDVHFIGVSPSVNDSWNLIDASSLNGTFDSISVTGATNLGLGQVLSVRQLPGGANGSLSQLFVDQRLILSVDRASGIASISNPGTEPIAFDGYIIRSPVGSIDSASWNSLAEQGFDGNNWFEFGTGGTPNALAELNPNAPSSIQPSAMLQIGAVFEPNFVTLGQETEDLEFTYTLPGVSSIVGVVHYVGDKQFNNLVLTVDPSTGEATLQNESAIPVSFDGYTITSDSGALLPAEGNWSSLQDQGLGGGDWFEINSTSFAIGELKFDGTTTLNQGEGFPLGSLFDTAGLHDLVFRFLLENDQTGFSGVVMYGDLPDLGGGGLLGDYNNSGQVEQGDLDLVLLNWGQSAVPPEWTNDLPIGIIDQAELDGVLLNWGNSAALGRSAAVPEPNSAVLVLLAGVIGSLLRRRDC